MIDVATLVSAGFKPDDPNGPRPVGFYTKVFDRRTSRDRQRKQGDRPFGVNVFPERRTAVLTSLGDPNGLRVQSSCRYDPAADTIEAVLARLVETFEAAGIEARRQVWPGKEQPTRGAT